MTNTYSRSSLHSIHPSRLCNKALAVHMSRALTKEVFYCRVPKPSIGSKLHHMQVVVNNKEVSRYILVILTLVR